MRDSLQDVIRAIVPRAARNWLRSPSKSLEWLSDSARFLLGNTEAFEILPNLFLICHPRAYKVFRRDQVEDPEQSAEFRNFISYCSGDMLLYDIGAHFGIFSSAAAYLGGRAIAVDASPAAADMIKIQAALNRCTDRIRVVCAAASDVNDTMEMLSSGVFSDGYFTASRRRPKSELTRVQAITIDRMALEFGAPTHIKIDVEGHEAAVLRGAKKTLSQFSPVLFLELHNEMAIAEGHDPNAVLEELARLRYSTFGPSGDAIDANGVLAAPIIRIVAKRNVG